MSLFFCLMSHLEQQHPGYIGPTPVRRDLEFAFLMQVHKMSLSLTKALAWESLQIYTFNGE